MDEAKYAIAFEIITFAGNARSNAMLAIASAREGEFDKSAGLLEEADRDLASAHGCQTKLLTSEARGEPVELNIILIHAQDHLMTAMLLRELADEMVTVHERLHAGVH